MSGLSSCLVYGQQKLILETPAHFSPEICSHFCLNKQTNTNQSKIGYTPSMAPALQLSVQIQRYRAQAQLEHHQYLPLTRTTVGCF